jgi:hypothetical protein
MLYTVAFGGHLLSMEETTLAFLWHVGLIVAAIPALAALALLVKAGSGPSPGGNDNATGVTVLLELARVYTRRQPYNTDLWLVSTGAADAGGERVGLLGLTRPSAARRAATRLAEALVLHSASPELAQSLPPEVRLARFSGTILISDFLDPVDAIAARLRAIAGADVSGHLVQVLDPAEETLPYDGRAEFIGPEDGAHWIADRVESLRERYQAKLAAHREALSDMARRLGWTLLVHHTDRPAAEPLLALAMRLRGEAGGQRLAGSRGMATSQQHAAQPARARDGTS